MIVDRAGVLPEAGALEKRSEGEDFVAEDPVLTFGILGVILGSVLIGCLFLLIRHAEPSWWASFSARLPGTAEKTHRARPRSGTYSSDKTLVMPSTTYKREPQRFSALLGKVSASGGSFGAFSGRVEVAAESKDEIGSGEKGSGKSFDLESLRPPSSAANSVSSTSLRLGTEIREPERALGREEAGLPPRVQSLVGRPAGGKGSVPALRVVTDFSGPPTAASTISSVSDEGTPVMTSTPTRLSSLSRLSILPPIVSEGAQTVPTPHMPAQTPTPRTPSPATPTRTPKSEKSRSRNSRPARPRRISSSPSTHSPISPSNLRKSYVPAIEADIITATRSSIVRPVTMLLTPSSSRVGSLTSLGPATPASITTSMSDACYTEQAKKILRSNNNEESVEQMKAGLETQSNGDAGDR